MKCFFAITYSLLMIFILSAQQYKPIQWPYGGIPEPHRKDSMTSKSPLKFGKINLYRCLFNKKADFVKSFSLDSFNISQSVFKKGAVFNDSKFAGTFQVGHTIFDKDVYALGASFEKEAALDNCSFNGDIVLNRSEFFGPSYLNKIKIKGDFKAVRTIFKNKFVVNRVEAVQTFILDKAVLLDQMTLQNSRFGSLDLRIKISTKPIFLNNLTISKDFYSYQSRCLDSVIVSKCNFMSGAFWRNCTFKKPLVFLDIRQQKQLDLQRSEFYDDLDLRGLDSLGANLEGALIAGKILAGNKEAQRLDLTRTRFSDRSKIILYDLAHLQIQPDKIPFIRLAADLPYSLKWSIIDELKSTVFPDNKKARFELDYLLAKSTMYQDKTEVQAHATWSGFKRFFRNFLHTIYYWTMGLGYRPFRLFAWVLILIGLYALIYFNRFKFDINDYLFKSKAKQINREEEFSHDHIHVIDSIINCLYFSSLIFLSFRLQSDILLHFTGRKRWIILSEWFSGLLIYISFLLFSKSGSILNTLTDLIFG